MVLGTLSLWVVDADGGSAAGRALAICAAGAQLLPLAELGVAAVAGPLPVALGMEQGMLIEANLLH